MQPVPTNLRRIEPGLSDPRLYLNRELSFLAFQRRVLAQAEDASVPLLERLRFLAICSTNLDEFFEIRVAGLKQQVAYGVPQLGSDGILPQDQLRAIHKTVRLFLDEQYALLNTVLLPELAKHGVRLLPADQWSDRQRQWLRRYFTTKVLPVLSPVGLDPSHPFPRIANKSLNVIVEVEGPDAYARDASIAVLQVPPSLPRVLAVPAGGQPSTDFVLISSVVSEHLAQVFPGMQVKRSHRFRLTRNSDLFVDEDEAEDLMHEIRGELADRKFGDEVRLEVDMGCPERLVTFLMKHFELGPDDVYRVDGPVNLHRLRALYDLVDRPELKYSIFRPATAPELDLRQDLFANIRKRDVLLHHPFQSFGPVVELIRQAAADPDVLAIKQTLYRTDASSPVVQALIDAARAGKSVTTVVELRARFDEAANIDLATRLQDAGASVVYGVVGLKTHAKMLLVVRREGKRIRRYVHLGTGNYHTGTARAYTDFGVMTCDRQIGEDVHQLFLQLTGLGTAKPLRRLLQAPLTLHDQLIKLIEHEASEARSGRASRIIAKMNSLSEPQVIRALYAASQAGVPIDLIVRGICCLRPGVPGVSETIRVRSIVGRFLEHSRVFFFHHGGKERLYLSSADWMNRNLQRRIEVAFPIREAKDRARVLDEGLQRYLEDTAQAWELQHDGNWERLATKAKRSMSAQDTLRLTLAAEPTGEHRIPRAEPPPGKQKKKKKHH